MWRWRPGEDCVFTVNSCYKLLEGLWLADGELNGIEKVVFGYLWKFQAPTKVLAFVGQLLLTGFQLE